MSDSIYDVTIIGGGPIGMFTAFYSGLRDLKTKVIERRAELGGQISMFYPQKILRDIGGIPEIAGVDLVKQLTTQMETFQPEVVFNQLIADLTILEDRTFRLTSKTGETHDTRTIVLAMGAGTLKPVLLEAEGVEAFSSSVHYFVQDMNLLKGKHICISGGGNSAVDWANELAAIAKSVTVIHRREDFTGHEAAVSAMKTQPNVHLYTSYQIKRLTGQAGQLQQVIIQHTETAEQVELTINECFINHGMASSYEGIEEWGIPMENNRFVVNEEMETNIPGIFAAGDAVTYPSKLKLIAGGFTEGPKAINSAVKYLNPKAEEMAMYSTHHEKLLELKKHSS